MLQLWKYAVDNEMVADDDTFAERIGFDKNNLSNIRSGRQSFTHKHVMAAAKAWKINVNWMYGIEPNMFRDEKKLTPISMLKAAVIAIENSLAGKK
jgi:DNA-binding transcriptional regulator YdaS (Cro superfamily)